MMMINVIFVCIITLIFISISYHLVWAHKLGSLFSISDFLIIKKMFENSFYIKLNSLFGQKMLTINNENILICRLKPNLYQGFIIYKNKLIKVGEEKSLKQLLLIKIPDVENAVISTKLTFGQYIDMNRFYFKLNDSKTLYEGVVLDNGIVYERIVYPALNNKNFKCIDP